MTTIEAAQQAEELLKANRGQRILFSAITEAILAAFEEGVLAERERQAVVRNQEWAGRG